MVECHRLDHAFSANKNFISQRLTDLETALHLKVLNIAKISCELAIVRIGLSKVMPFGRLAPVWDSSLPLRTGTLASWNARDRSFNFSRLSPKYASALGSRLDRGHGIPWRFGIAVG